LRKSFLTVLFLSIKLKIKSPADYEIIICQRMLEKKRRIIMAKVGIVMGSDSDQPTVWRNWELIMK